MKFKFLLLSVAVVMLFVLQSPMSLTRAEKSQILDIETFPRDKFLEMDQLKPGDKVISSLDVLNKGNVLFTYKTTAEFTEGSKRYYDALHLEIIDDKDKILYNGSLKDFQGLEPRTLVIFTKDRLIIKVEVPAELGNEYQGLSAGFKLNFMAEGDGAIPADGNELPNTATNNYNFLFSGLILMGSGLAMYFYRKKNLQ